MQHVDAQELELSVGDWKTMVRMSDGEASFRR